MAQKVAQVHGPNHPAAVELGQEVRALADHAEAWLALESREILPRLSPGALGAITVTRSKMKEGHEERRVAMARIRVLTESYRPWEGACGTVARLYAGLGRLESILAEYARVDDESLDAFMPG
jgi:iron-sulfur cluster repair protein YtfE (RIC family)